VEREIMAVLARRAETEMSLVEWDAAMHESVGVPTRFTRTRSRAIPNHGAAH
jgi:hypothetical protein